MLDKKVYDSSLSGHSANAALKFNFDKSLQPGNKYIERINDNQSNNPNHLHLPIIS